MDSNDRLNELASSLVGDVLEWEQRRIDSLKGKAGLVEVLLDMAEEQTSLSRSLLWLQVAFEAGDSYCKMIYLVISYHYYREKEIYKADEMSMLWRRIKETSELKYIFDFDSNGSRAYRCFIRTLLSGSFNRNQHSSLYTSFFQSKLCEVHLLPIVARYIVGEKANEKGMKEERNKSNATSLPVSYTFGGPYHKQDTLYLIRNLLLSDFSDITLLDFNAGKYMNLSLLLPLFLHQFPNVTTLKCVGPQLYSSDELVSIDLSLFKLVDMSKIEYLYIGRFKIQSLSPLSLSSLSLSHVSSLRELHIGFSPSDPDTPTPLNVEGLVSLDGLNLIHTASLHLLSVTCPDLIDISSLSLCDLSSLHSLCFPSCSSLSDFSPLSRLTLSVSNVSINLDGTALSDISPFESLCHEGVVVVSVRDTPVSKRMKEEGLKSPHCIGKVQLIF